MVQVHSEENEIRVQVSSESRVSAVKAKTKKSNNAVDTSNSMAEYWADVSKGYAETAQRTVSEAISGIQQKETESINNIQSYTNSSITALQNKYEELKEKLSTTYIHEQGEVAEVWTINHNLNKKPSIVIVDTADNVVEGVEKYIDENNIEIHFNNAFKGKAYLN